MSSEGDIAPRRLHPAGIAVLGVGALRGLALPLGVAFAGAVLGAGGGGGGQPLSRAVLFGLFGALLAAAAGVAGWLTTRWSVGEDTIRLRKGVIATREIDVPLSRVQAIDTVHGPLQRLFGVRGVQVQTAGGGRDSEIALPAVSAADVELLGAALRRRRGGGDLVAPEVPRASGVLRRMGNRDLLLAALTSGQMGVILPALAVVPQLANEIWGGNLQSAEREGLRAVPDSAIEWIAAALLLVLVAWLVSSIGTVLAFARFTISRDDDRLRISRGLIAHREATVPVGRVQAIRVVEGLLRAPFGLLTLRAEVAGYAREAAAAQTLFPLLRRTDAEAFLREVLPEHADALGPLERPPRRALRRYVLAPTAGWLILGAAVAVAVPAAAPWTLLAALPAGALGAARWQAAGWRIRGGRVAIRSRRLARVTVLAPAARLQQHGVRQTVLQRRAGLADFDVRVGASTHAGVRHLEADAAGHAFDALSRS